MVNDKDEDIDITRSNRVWKFRSKEVLIDDMDKESLLYAAIHAMKRMHYYNKQVHYSQYRFKISQSDKEQAKWEKNKKKSSDIMLMFAEKLEIMEERASELGFQIPDKYEEVKDMLRQHQKTLEKK